MELEEVKRRKFKRLELLGLLICLIAMLLCGCITDDDDVEERVRVGDKVPLFTVDVIDNGERSTFSTADIDGETVIVFFNTSCEDCRRELPKLNDYYLRHRDEAGFCMVAISREEGEESVAAYWHDNSLQIPYSAQTDRRIYSLFASSVIPRVYYCSPQGIITKIFVENS